MLPPKVPLCKGGCQPSRLTGGLYNPSVPYTGEADGPPHAIVGVLQLKKAAAGAAAFFAKGIKKDRYKTERKVWRPTFLPIL